MTEQQRLALLIDLAKLLKKYGLKSFEDLTELLSSPKMNQHLSEVISQVASAGRVGRETEGKKATPRRKQPVPRALIMLETKDPEKYQLLMKFHNELISKTILPSFSDIKQFASELGLPEICSKSRKEAINPLISALVGFSHADLTEKLQALSKYPSSDRSLEGWSKIILNKKEN